MRGAVFLRSVRLVALTAAALSIVASGVHAQGTTQAYPWRLSYFPYVTASPNDGLMPMARVVWFQASRWDARTSVDRQVAVEGGYSTKDAWLVRVQGDFPRLAPGWRLQASADALNTPELEVLQSFGAEAERQSLTVELTRRVAGPLLLAARGTAAHIGARFYAPGSAVDDTKPRNYETDWHARVAAVIDLRDREYDTRRGALLQTGLVTGHYSDNYRGISLSSGDYTGWYGMAAGWLPLSASTRVTARLGARTVSIGAENGIEAERSMPAWEDDILGFGGPQSNRGLPVAGVAGRGMLLAGMELRRDLFTFPGGAVAVLAFVDGGRAFVDDACVFTAEVASGQSKGFAVSPTCGSSGALRLTFDGWTVSPGGGIAIRLLRNAVLTATVGVAHGDARVYVSNGWSW
jgi:hypothetical protein